MPRMTRVMLAMTKLAHGLLKPTRRKLMTTRRVPRNTATTTMPFQISVTPQKMPA